MTQFIAETEAEATLLRVATSMNAGDLSGIDACFTEDFVRYGEETNWEPMSKAVYRGWVDDFMAAFPDVSWEILDMTSKGNRVALSIIERGTFAHPWEIRGRMIEPTNTEYVTHAAIFFVVSEDNLIQSYTYIHDTGFVTKYGDLLDAPSVTAAVPEEHAPDGMSRK